MSEEKLNPLVELVLARLREFYREPAIVFWVFGFPLLMALGLGAAFRSKPPELPRIGVVMVEESAESLELLEKLKAHPAAITEVYDRESADRALSRAKVDVLVLFDAEGYETVIDATQEKGARAQLEARDILQTAAGRKDPLRERHSRVTKPGSRYVDFLIPGILGMNIMGSSLWGVGYNLVVARKRKLLRRYGVTPMRRPHFLLSYFISRSLFLVLELGVLVAFGKLFFGMTVQGGLLSLVVISILGAAAFAGISLVIGARISNTETANGWTNLVQMPMWLLSGVFFTYERFPEFLHTPIRMLPLTALVDGLRGVYNDGLTLAGLLPEVLVLAVWGTVGFLIALRTFRWQ